jgi:oligoendopeptidase F
MIHPMTTHGPAGVPAQVPKLRTRDDIDPQFKWDLTAIFPGWDAWEAAYREIEQQVERYRTLKGTLAAGPDRILEALRLADEMGQLAFKVWYFASLSYDEDQRDNLMNARRQRVQVLLARWKEATAWFKPEVLAIPLETVQGWFAASPALAVYRFALEDLYRQQEHVLDEQGERLLSLASRLTDVPDDAYGALSTADAKHPSLMLSTGQEVVLTYGEYRAILETNRNQQDRAAAFHAFHQMFADNLNTYAALYNGVLQRDWFLAESRGYRSTLDAALHGDNIPISVVENLIRATREGTEPLRRYHRLRRRVLGVETYHAYDTFIPLVAFDRRYRYEEVLDRLVASVEVLGPAYQTMMREALASRWIDVYETVGKRSGAYSAPVYGVHPYMLLNYTGTLDAVFTLAHEMGHSMHTLFSHAHQPFVYSSYTIFVAEVPSTLSEALFLEYMLARTGDPRERLVLLQHAIDEIVGTFYTQVLFADFELQAHRQVERGEPITADGLGTLYFDLLKSYYGDAFDYDELSRVTWARIPHFYGSPYYVYQYATCFASAARLFKELMNGPDRDGVVERYLSLLKAGGNDYPMAQLLAAGVDLRQPETVQAVVGQCGEMVTRLERELEAVLKQ